MPYATADDFIATLSDKEAAQLSNRNNPTAKTPDYDRIERSAVAASGIIDSYLSGRYEVPITIPVAIEPLRHHCIRLMRCEMDSVSTREKCQADCDRTYEWLREVAKGRIELGMPGLTAQPDLTGSTSGPRSMARGKKAIGIDLAGY
jgi:phage gp36-like protein